MSRFWSIPETLNLLTTSALPVIALTSVLTLAKVGLALLPAPPPVVPPNMAAAAPNLLLVFFWLESFAVSSPSRTHFPVPPDSRLKSSGLS